MVARKMNRGTRNGTKNKSAKRGTLEQDRKIHLIPVSCIHPDPIQPRMWFDKEKISGIANSMKVVGQETPIKVYPHPKITNGKVPQYMIEDGECRWRAAQEAGIKFLDCIVMTSSQRPSDGDHFAHSVAANFGKSNHTTLEKICAMSRLKEEGRTVDDIASIFCCAVPTVYQHLSLLRLHPDVLKMMHPEPGDSSNGSIKKRGEQTVLTFSLALLLQPLPQEIQLRVAQKVIGQKMSVAKARHEIEKESMNLGHTPKSSRTQPNRMYQSLGTFVESVAERSQIFVEKENVEAIVRTRSLIERETLVDILKQAIEDLTTILEDAKKTLPEPKRRSSGF